MSYLNSILNVKENDIINRIKPIYKSINLLKNNMDYKNKSLIGFAGAPWTLLLYMIHKQSPKKNFNKKRILNDKNLLNYLIVKLEDIICLHIDKQIDAGANVIQLFDSWAGLLSRDDLTKYCYSPTLKIVNHIKNIYFKLIIRKCIIVLQIIIKTMILFTLLKLT